MASFTDVSTPLSNAGSAMNSAMVNPIPVSIAPVASRLQESSDGFVAGRRANARAKNAAPLACPGRNRQRLQAQRPDEIPQAGADSGICQGEERGVAKATQG